MASKGSTFSVIGPDVTVRGDLEATADLHVDGTVIGDIVCASLVQGDGSRIEGSVQAETARLSGHVKGTIAARDLVVLRSARIEGDVSYETLTIEQGATVDGRFALSDRRQPAQSVVTDSGGGTDSEPKLTLAS